MCSLRLKKEPHGFKASWLSQMDQQGEGLCKNSVNSEKFGNLVTAFSSYSSLLCRFHVSEDGSAFSNDVATHLYFSSPTPFLNILFRKSPEVFANWDTGAVLDNVLVGTKNWVQAPGFRIDWEIISRIH